MIHEKVEYSHLRVYSEGCSYENKDEYLCIMSVHHLGDDEVYVCGLKGIMTRQIHKAIRLHFDNNGVKVVRYERATSDGRVVQKKQEVKRDSIP